MKWKDPTRFQINFEANEKHKICLFRIRIYACFFFFVTYIFWYARWQGMKYGKCTHTNVNLFVEIACKKKKKVLKWCCWQKRMMAIFKRQRLYLFGGKIMCRPYITLQIAHTNTHVVSMFGTTRKHTLTIVYSEPFWIFRLNYNKKFALVKCFYRRSYHFFSFHFFFVHGNWKLVMRKFDESQSKEVLYLLLHITRCTVHFIIV